MTPTQQEQEEERIRGVVDPPKVCPWCCQERGQPMPVGASTAICVRHWQQVIQEGRR
jgi:hypothetical protein